MKKQIEKIIQIIPLNRNLIAIHEQEGREFKRLVVSAALVGYVDGTQGMEFMEIAQGLKIDFLDETVIALEDVYENTYSPNDEAGGRQ